MKDIEDLYDYNVPDYDVIAEGEYEYGEFSKYRIDDGITVKVDSFGSMVLVGVFVEPSVDVEEALWKSVYWCRSYGVTGVCNEKLTISQDGAHKEYRLGALYCVAGFDFTERESNYQKYGESPAHET
jgi:hypothetical protein